MCFKNDLPFKLFFSPLQHKCTSLISFLSFQFPVSFFNVSTSGTCRLQKNEFFVRASAKGVKGAHCTGIPL